MPKKKKPDFGAALANLEEANDVANSTKDAMKAQTAQMESMDAAMDEIGDNLNKTDALCNDLEDDTEPSLFETFFGYAKSPEEKRAERLVEIEAKASEAGAEEAKQYDNQKPIKAGWLVKRGASLDSGWERVWCCLFPSVLSIYQDESKEEKKSDVILSRSCKVHKFAKGLSPGDAFKYRPEKEFGFVVDPDPEGGRRRPFFYFDGEDKKNMVHWMKHIDHVAKVLMKKWEKEQEGDDLAKMNALLDGLEASANEMGEEAKKQAELVEKLDSKVDAATEQMKEQTERLQNLP
eukprot:TRINITY_DN34407_c0_g1_i1.p1 TRINITY_DN34407_c0_g1~~TRINITY_DN34407_c0_g1_i1.p1  ORF type:complete len:331 (+),score=80.46 TRINITY_DN34407_c0_g1_i1:120-995(+)